MLELASAAGAEVRARRSGVVLRFEVGAGLSAGEHRSGLVFVGHVEEAEARQGVGFEQALLEELLLDLLDLDGLHLAAVGGELAVGLGAEGGEFGLRGLR